MLAPRIAREASVAAGVNDSGHDPISGLEASLQRRCLLVLICRLRRRPGGTASRELVLRDDAFLEHQGLGRVQPLLVVARLEIFVRRYPLNCPPKLVEVPGAT